MAKVFDGHLHTFRFKVPVRESIDLFKRQFKRFGVEKGTFLALPCDPVYRRTGLEVTDPIDNVRAMYFKAVFAPNFYAYAGLEYAHLDLNDKKAVADDLLRQVKELKAIGFDGMKMYEGHPNMRMVLGYALDDEVYDKYFDFCEKENFPIIMHLANPPYMWVRELVGEYWANRGCYFDPAVFPKFEDFHEEVLKRLAKNPKLNFTLAHWGFIPFNQPVANKFMAFENTKLDVCPGGDNFIKALEDIDFWQPFIEKYSDRITYGTDSYNFEYDCEETWVRATGARPQQVQAFFQGQEFPYGGKTYKGITLKQEQIDNIFFNNLYNMLGEPNKIDFDYFINKCNELIKGFEPKDFEYYNLWCMKNDLTEIKNKGYLPYANWKD